MAKCNQLAPLSFKELKGSFFLTPLTDAVHCTAKLSSDDFREQLKRDDRVISGHSPEETLVFL